MLNMNAAVNTFNNGTNDAIISGATSIVFIISIIFLLSLTLISLLPRMRKQAENTSSGISRFQEKNSPHGFQPSA